MIRLILFSVALCFTGHSFGQDLLVGSDYHMAKGDSLCKEGRFVEAKEHLKMALLSDKSNAELSYLMAQVHLKLDEIGPAEKQLRRASRIGYYKADVLLDSLSGRNAENQENVQFKKDLEEYLDQTGSSEREIKR